MNLRAPVPPRKLLTFLGLLFGALGLVLTLMQGSVASEAEAMGIGFAGFSLCLNAALLLIYVGEVSPVTRFNLFRTPQARAIVLGFAALALIYAFATLGAPGEYHGAADIANRLTYYLCPALYLLWWVIGQPHGALRWSQLPLLLAPALLYLGYCLLRALWAQQTQYPFLDATLSTGTVASHAALAIALFAAAYAIIVGLDHFLGRKRTSTPA